MRESSNYHFDTLAIHAGQEVPEGEHGARAVPIYQTTSYVFESTEDAAGRFDFSIDAFAYSRTGNPTQLALEQRMAALEGGRGALAVASGIAAVATSLETILAVGDHLVSASTIYGGAYALFSGLFSDAGIETTFVDPTNPENFARAFRSNTKAVFFESIGNPNSNLVDIEAVVQLAHERNIPVFVDNTFATPWGLCPAAYGADVIIHSATKFIGGHGTTLGGVIIDAGTFDWAQEQRFPRLNRPDPTNQGVIFSQTFGKDAYLRRARSVVLRDRGASLAPMNAFLLLQGLETLPLRMQRHHENTQAVLELLTQHPAVEYVHHPSLPDSPDHALWQRYLPRGGGSIFTFEVKGGQGEAYTVLNALELFSLLVNVADLKSLATHPATTTHSSMTPEQRESAGITPASIRLSIGCEDARDLKADLKQALDQVLTA
jgi:O-acetylhomoserine (thiol)-lyase